MQMVNLMNLSREELATWFAGRGHKPFRGGQVYRWLYHRGAENFAAMTDLSAALRQELEETAVWPRMQLAHESRSADGTRKYLFRLPDGETVETVWIPEDDRVTLCISTQVGCAMGCGFCLTAQGGLTRNLETWEIVGQLLEARRRTPPEQPITNVVMMGMGEPLHNLGAVIPALRHLLDDQGIHLAPRRVTVSTVGLVPQMVELGRAMPQVNLAVSLGAATDEVRGTLIPAARRWPLDDLMAACRAYPLPPRRRIFFEYILIRGVNDSPKQARELVRRVHGVRCKVNLMAMNPIPGAPWERPDDADVLQFQKILGDSGVRAFVRKSRGQDILAACGQLRSAQAESAPLLPR